MAARPVWRGHLRLALVSCPIALHTVHRTSGGLHFHLLNPKTNHRVRMVTMDAETDEELSRGDLVRGYEFEKDRYVVLEPEDFESAKIESSSVLTIDKFVDMAEIPAIYFDASYYLAPDGEAGQDVFAVLREAIARSGKAALSRVVISRRERAVALLPMGEGMVLHTLHEKRDIYDAKPLFAPLADEKADPEMVKLATQLIDRQVAAFQPSDIEDRYEQRLREVIDAKLQGAGGRPAETAAPQRDNVVDLMAALKQSLSRGAESARKPAAAAAPTSETAAPASPPKSKAAAARSRSTRKRA
ncbi:MAG: Ku protein [Pseudomonadota bacterium]|nr:Ku protein [Pseudomonadota bacterium]